MRDDLRHLMLRAVEFIIVAVILAVCAVIWATPARGQTIFSDGFETPCTRNCGGDPPVPPDACVHPETGLNLDGIKPFGWVGHQLTWRQAFSAPICLQNPRDRRCIFATYPTGLGVPVPIGTFKGAYLSIPFTTLPNLTVDMSWDTAQANAGIGYGMPRPADLMWIAISPCAGDMRPPDATDNPWTKPGCRVLAGGASLFYRTFGSTNPAFCTLKPNETYYLTVSPSNPLDGLEFGEHTCSTSAVNSAFRCDVQVRSAGRITASREDRN